MARNIFSFSTVESESEPHCVMPASAGPGANRTMFFEVFRKRRFHSR